MTRNSPIPETMTLHVPFRVVKRGGRKEMQLPVGVAPPRRTDNTLVKALARAFRWKRMLESREFATIAELAEREGIAPSYLTRVLRLTLLAPDIVEAILDGKPGHEVTLARLLKPFASDWHQQPAALSLQPSAFSLQPKRRTKIKNVGPFEFNHFRATAMISLDYLAALDRTKRKRRQPKQRAG